MSAALISKSDGHLLRWHSTEVSPGIEEDITQLSGVIRDVLSQLVGKRNKVEIWTALDSDLLKIKQLVLPDLPVAKIATAAFWSLKKDAAFNEASEVLDFEIQDTVKEGAGKKKKILVYTAPQDRITQLKKIFSNAGFPLTGITALPFAIQNLFKKGYVHPDGDHFAVVNIRRDNSEIFCYSKSGLALVRSLRTGSFSLTEELDIPDETDPIDYLSSIKPDDTATFSGMEDVSERLIGKIARTGDYFTMNYSGNVPLDQYLFYGDTDKCAPFMSMATSMIPARVTPLLPTGDKRGGRTRRLPETAHERNRITTAYNLGLSIHGETPNFLFTHVHRQQEKTKKRLNIVSLIAGIALIAAAVSAQFYLTSSLTRAKADLAGVRLKQTRFTTPETEDLISRRMAEAEERLGEADRYINGFRPLGAVSELFRITPPDIKLTALSYQHLPEEELQKDKGQAKGQAKKIRRQLRIRGMLAGTLHHMDTSFGNYLLSLSGSPLFGKVDVREKERTETFAGSGEMTFTAVVEVR
ncbi:MAG: hypothetical protein MI802_04950 [Desulfobacterales bacterium]|nr:hypothetical protein [Desulfobacterales bacterium]